MKRWKHVFKKGMAFVLSLAMVAGLVLAMSGGANTVQAATGSGTEPSVTAYATKDQLMTAFNPDSNGDATTIGKLVFGKNSSSVAQECRYGIITTNGKSLYFQGVHAFAVIYSIPFPS